MSLRIEIAAAVNNREILAECLERSPCIASGEVVLRTYEGYRTAGIAYNDALDAATGDILVLVHQDVYLPTDFIARLTRQLEEIEQRDPDWAVAGAVGMGQDGAFHGSCWSSGLQMFVNQPDGLPMRAESFDEVMLIIRCSAGLRFDPDLPSFHLYGTDIAQIAAQAGRTCWIIHLPIIHHSGTVKSFMGGYTDAYMYMRRKWWSSLPIRNITFNISRSLVPLVRTEARLRWRNMVKPRKVPASADVLEIARRCGVER